MASSFAAIAFSQSTGQAGISWSAPDRASAEKKALEACPASDAKIVGWVQNAWGALAVGDGNGYAFGWGNSSEQAQQVALNECGTVTTNGSVTVLLHSEHGQYQPSPTPSPADHGYRLVSTGCLPSYRQCEWCGRTFDASEGCWNHVVHGWFSTERYGYFCSPRCVREADLNGFGGTPHQ